MSIRYAIYYAPAEKSPLWRFGSSVIGYDAARGVEVNHPKLSSLSLAALTEEPRRYGFHATLKAPFEPVPGADEAALVMMLESVARRHRAFVIPKLEVVAIGSFVALVPAEPVAPLRALADDCVEAFEPFRAAMSETDRARRKPERLTRRQREHLDRYGYPYVFEDFRFHMTLTGPLKETERTPILRALSALHALIEPKAEIGSVTLFRQASRTERFVIAHRAALAPMLATAAPGPS